MRTHLPTVIAAGILAAAGATAVSAQTLPASFTVPNDPATGPLGFTTTLTGATSSTTLSFTVSGEAFLQPGNTYGTNAAGVVTTAGSATNSPVGTSLIDGSSGYTYGALLATLNGQTVQVFATSTANGLGGGAIPTRLTYSGTLGQLFSLSGGTVLPTVSTLSFRVDDSGYSDNSGGFAVTSGAVPEPATWAMAVAGFGMVGLGLRRRARQAVRVTYA